jgi:hypothetical protein
MWVQVPPLQLYLGGNVRLPEDMTSDKLRLVAKTLDDTTELIKYLTRDDPDGTAKRNLYAKLDVTTMQDDIRRWADELGR